MSFREITEREREREKERECELATRKKELERRGRVTHINKQINSPNEMTKLQNKWFHVYKKRQP